MGESSLRVLDYGDTAGPDSRGLFQQRGNGAWGSYADRMDPRRSSLNFYRALLAVPDWASLPPTIDAHQTQHNADPYYYEPFYADADADAVAVVAALSGNTTDTTSTTDLGALGTTGNPVFDALAAGGLTGCDASMATSGGAVVYPVPPSMVEANLDNWGGQGSRWSSWHTGTDFSVPCGTPVLAATAGTVEIDTTQSWAGRWLVKITTGPTTVSTWYAHMQALDVTAGQVVAAGEVIGEVGAEGNSTGCHLHFEVHLKNGSIYGPDNVDPTPWLDANVGKTTPLASLGTHGGSGVGAAPTAGSFRVASLNALGNSHTAGGGNKHGYAPGPVRMRGVVSLLDGYGVSLVGFQELQGPQAAAFGALHGSDWALFHARGDSENSIAWRTDTWQVVSTSLVSIPYFDGNTRRIPLVQLRLRATGQTVWMLNAHNPADTPRYHHQRRFRVRGIAIERRVIARIQARGQAVLFTGDLNDRAEAFCPLTAGGLMGSYLGGTNPAGPACQPPSPAPIDWIFATPDVAFESSTVDKTPRDTLLTDHPMALTQAHLN